MFIHDTTVILVSYNSALVVCKAIESIVHCPEVKHCVVVDNASTDQTCQLIRAGFPHVEIILNKENLGYGKGCNVALERVNTRFALIINPDSVVHSGALSEMLRTMNEYPDAGIVAPLILDDNSRVTISYKRNIFMREKYGNGLDIVPDGDCCAEFVSGAVWLIRMQAYAAVGGFDTNIFLYYEDDDFCLRLRKNNYSIILAVNASVSHMAGRSSGPSLTTELIRQEHILWSRLYIQQKYHGVEDARTLARKLRFRYMLKLIGCTIWFRRRRRMHYMARLVGIRKYYEQSNVRS